MRRLFIALAMICLTLPLFFHAEASGHEVPSSGPAGDIGINERTGQNIPLDEVFYDEQGNTTSLKQLFNRPVVLSLVYYSCDRICPQLLSALAERQRNCSLCREKIIH